MGLSMNWCNTSGLVGYMGRPRNRDSFGGVSNHTHSLITYYRYKILFLDVLFPLNIKKIIFVDADQVN